jgi:hypothetical protein
MKLIDNNGTHYIPDLYGVNYVSVKKYEHWSKRKRKGHEWSVIISFGRDNELWLTYSSEKKAQAAYDRLVDRIKEEQG